MELNHDWRAFRAVFEPRKRAAGSKPALPEDLSGCPVYAVVDGKIIISAIGVPGEDLQEWTGRPWTDLAASLTHREVITFDRKEVDTCLIQSLSLAHCYDQSELVRSQRPKGLKADSSQKGHFVLEAIQGWWAKVLPSSYGLFLRMESGAGATVSSPVTVADHPQEAFVLVRRGRIELFHSPDLSSLGNDRARSSQAVIKYLSEKHGVPVQGLFVHGPDWAEWSDPAHAGDAWRSLAMAVQSHEAQLVPFRWQIMALIATRAFLGL